jgi:uncharacterized repeat protein (TIGR03803 family)
MLTGRAGLEDRVSVRISVLGAAALIIVACVPRNGAAADREKLLDSPCASTGCNDNSGPAGPIMAAAGYLSGTNREGGADCRSHGQPGCGTVFKPIADAVPTSWTESVLYSFCAQTNCVDGEGPPVGLIIDGSGNLYGTTSAGGAHGGGTVFELIPDAARTTWTQTILASFCARTNCADDGGPEAALIMDQSGNLYGTTYGGGAHGKGAVFELTPNAARTNWTETVPHSFCAKAGCADGENPEVALIVDRSGNLYGTTGVGGAHGKGAVFELTPNANRTKWSEAVLYSFCAQTICADGEYPDAGLIMDRSGNLYGTTAGGGVHQACGQHFCVGGTVFELTPNPGRTNWTETVLHSFCAEANCLDGAGPSGVIMDGSGNLYGTTIGGGAYGFGTVFELNL